MSFLTLANTCFQFTLIKTGLIGQTKILEQNIAVLFELSFVILFYFICLEFYRRFV